MSNISTHFRIEEFVPKHVFEQFGVNAKWFVRPEVVKYMEFVRNHFGKAITINNWHTGGTFNFRGMRTSDCAEYKPFSQHSLVGAVDYNVEGMTSDEVYDYILAHEAEFMAAGLTTMENKAMTKGWTHNDFRWTGLPHIFIVEPTK